MTPAQLYPGFDPNAPAIKAPIELGVKPLCDALNSLAGVHTLWSCEGHPEDGLRPYATFIGPSETAFAINCAIGRKGETAKLHFCWYLNATFRIDGTLQYTIEPNDYRIRRQTWAERLFSHRSWSKQIMESDLFNLAKLVSNLK